MTNETFDDLTDQELETLCQTYDSKVLAMRVVIFRHLDLQKRLAIQCMKELVSRRNSGDDFDYESYIKEKLKQMPALQIDTNQRNTIVGLLSGGMKSYGE